MLDERKLEAAFEAEVAGLEPGPGVWAGIRRETAEVPAGGRRGRGKSQRSGWLGRLNLGRKLEVLAACVLFAVLLGVAALRGVNAPSHPGGGVEFISREAAIAAASHGLNMAMLEVRGAELVEQYQLNGKEMAVWRVEFQNRGQTQPYVIYFVDARSGEVVWSKYAPESQGGVGGGEAGWQDYTPIKLQLRDHPGTSRDLIANPDDAIAAGLRALGGQVDYSSPPISPTPGYVLTVRGPDGEVTVLAYVGEGNWATGATYVEGKALAEAVAAALPVPERKPGQLEYLFGATELTISPEGDQRLAPAEVWNRRRQTVVRVLLTDGQLDPDLPVPEYQPQVLNFVVNGQVERVEVWQDAFRYSGRVYHATDILRTLGTNMNAG